MAYKQANSASLSLMDNIIKLCSGLRSLGQDKYAQELEQNFINYKQATTLYETSKETGEDLVDSAHPEGSHKLVGVLGDNVIETILDTHLKMVTVVNKNPTGKLASKKDILRAVKTVLAEDTLEQQLDIVMSKIFSNANAIHSLTESELTIPLGMTMPLNLRGFFDEKISNPSVGKIQDIKDYLATLRYRLKPHFLDPMYGTGLSEESYNIKAKPLLDNMDALINRAADLKTKIDQGQVAKLTDSVETKPTEQKPLIPTEISQFDNKVQTAINALNSFRVKISSDPDNTENDKKTANRWIDLKLSSLSSLKKQFDTLDQASQLQSVDGLIKNLEKITADFGAFKTQWIG